MSLCDAATGRDELEIASRHCHGSGKPVTRAGRVLAGTGTGRHSATRQKPLPESRVSRVSVGLTYLNATVMSCCEHNTCFR
jgi:hypothetical protein